MAQRGRRHVHATHVGQKPTTGGFSQAGQLRDESPVARFGATKPVRPTHGLRPIEEEEGLSQEVAPEEEKDDDEDEGRMEEGEEGRTPAMPRTPQ